MTIFANDWHALLAAAILEDQHTQEVAEQLAALPKAEDVEPWEGKKCESK